MKDRQDKGSQPTKRVFKSSDVHKRRIDKGASSRAAKKPAAEQEKASPKFVAMMGEKKPEPEASHQQTADQQPSDQEESSQQRAQQSASREATRRQPTRRQPAVVSEASEADGLDGASAREDALAEQQAPSNAPRRLQLPAAPRRRVVALVGAGVLVVLLVAVGVFAFNRWMRYDDHADLQGTWYIYNTDVPITIDDEYIHFNDEVSYRYTIDPAEKTMSYTFGPMQGHGRYWFSDDRTHLVITDGDGFTAAGTTVEDLLHAFVDFGVASSGDAVELPSGEGIIAFSRQPEVGLTDEQVAQKAEEQALRERAGNPTVEGSVARSVATGAAAIEWTLENRYYDYNPYTGSYYYFFGQTSYGGATNTENGSYYGGEASYDGQQYYQDEYYDYGQTTYADAAGYYEEVG